MKLKVMMIWILVVPTLGACVYAPLVSHSIKSKHLESFDASQCVGLITSSNAVKRACLLRNRVEAMRRTHEIVSSTTSSLLVPAAGLVAYRAARQQSLAANSAVAAGGLALYATVGAFSPDARIEAYTRASRALTCGLGVYQSASVGALSQAVARLNLAESEERYKTKAKAVSDQQLKSAQKLVDAITEDLQSVDPLAELNAELDAFSEISIEDLNELLRGTLPTLASLAPSIASLQPKPPVGDPDLVRSALAAEMTSANALTSQADPKTAEEKRAEKSELAAELQTLIRVANELIDHWKIAAVSADFTPCRMSVAALASQGLYKPLALGPGNSKSGQTVEVKVGTPLQIVFTGGQSPYSVAVTGEPAALRPDATLQMQGVGILDIKAKTADASDHTFDVIVFDSIGASSTVHVKVPKAEKQAN